MKRLLTSPSSASSAARRALVPSVIVDQRLGLAAGEQRRAVGARQHADLAGDRRGCRRCRGRRCGVPVFEHHARAACFFFADLERRADSSAPPTGNASAQRRLDLARRPRRAPRSARACRGSPSRASIFWLAELARPRSTIAGSLAGGTNSRFALPTAARSFSCRSMQRLAPPGARTAARRSSTSSAARASRPRPSRSRRGCAATTRSMSDFSRSANVGLTTNSPSMRPTRTPATGRPTGCREMCSAARGAGHREHVGRRSPCRTRRTVRDDLGLDAPALGEQRADGRSIRRQVRISSSVVRPSRLK